MTHHVLAVYKTPTEASIATERLLAAGVPNDAISLVMGEGYHADHIGIEPGNKSAEGVATGATIGGALGAIAAGVAATGAVVASGGSVLVAGPLAAALAGAGAGGATGGVLGGLMGMGVPEKRVKSYEHAVDKDAGMVLGVEVTDAIKHDVKEILKDAGGEAISEE